MKILAEAAQEVGDLLTTCCVDLHESRLVVIGGEDQLTRSLQLDIEHVRSRPGNETRKAARRSDVRFVDDGRVSDLESYFGPAMDRLLLRVDRGAPASGH